MVAGSVTVSNTTNRSFKCARFDGVDDEFTIAEATAANFLDLTKNYSISLWYKSAHAVANTLLIGSKYSAAGDIRSWVITRESTGKFRFQASTDGTSPNLKTAGSPNVIITDNKWHNLVAVRNSTEIISYTDGIAGTGTAFTGGKNSSININFGHLLFGDTQWFPGEIANINFYNVDLNETEIDQLKTGLKVERGLVHRYNFKKDNYDDSIGTSNGTNSGSIITIVDDAIATAAKAQRVGANDKWLAFRGEGGQVGVINIEE